MAERSSPERASPAFPSAPPVALTRSPLRDRCPPLSVLACRRSMVSGPGRTSGNPVTTTACGRLRSGGWCVYFHNIFPRAVQRASGVSVSPALQRDRTHDATKSCLAPAGSVRLKPRGRTRPRPVVPKCIQYARPGPETDRLARAAGDAIPDEDLLAADPRLHAPGADRTGPRRAGPGRLGGDGGRPLDECADRRRGGATRRHRHRTRRDPADRAQMYRRRTGGRCDDHAGAHGERGRLPVRRHRGDAASRLAAHAGGGGGPAAGRHDRSEGRAGGGGGPDRTPDRGSGARGNA